MNPENGNLWADVAEEMYVAVCKYLKAQAMYTAWDRAPTHYRSAETRAVLRKARESIAVGRIDSERESMSWYMEATEVLQEWLTEGEHKGRRQGELAREWFEERGEEIAATS